MFLVYLIRNSINGKLYVGKTSDLDRRWAEHLTIARGGRLQYPKHHHYLHSAITKHGASNFEVLVLKIFESENESLLFERNTISSYLNSGVKLYNLTTGGEGRSIRPPKQNTLVPSEGWHQKPPSIPRGRGGAYHTGIKHSEESKTKISNSLLGRQNSLGYKHTPESKRKMSEAKQRYLQNR